MTCKLHCALEENTIFHKHLPLSIMPLVSALQASGLIYQIFPLHETSALTRLQINWVRKLFAAQPLDDIAEYFGVKVALYFAWLGHYTCALGIPAIFGIILWAALYDRSQVAQDMGHVLFSLFNVAWASLYLEAWRRYSVELAFRWGTLSTPPELLETPRPLFKVRTLFLARYDRPTLRAQNKFHSGHSG